MAWHGWHRWRWRQVGCGNCSVYSGAMDNAVGRGPARVHPGASPPCGSSPKTGWWSRGQLRVCRVRRRNVVSDHEQDESGGR